MIATLLIEVNYKTNNSVVVLAVASFSKADVVLESSFLT
jgi:hypothetical protein